MVRKIFYWAENIVHVDNEIFDVNIDQNPNILISKLTGFPYL